MEYPLGLEIRRVSGWKRGDIASSGLQYRAQFGINLERHELM
jgi:hypothetical protein